MQTVIVVDDHILFREGLVSLLKNQPDFNVVGEAGNVQGAIQAALRLRPDVILMDFSLPDGTGLDAAVAILAQHPQAKIVFLTMHEEDDRLFAAIRSGAKGYLLKNIPVNQLLTSLRGLENDEAPLSRSMTSRLITEFSRQAQRLPTDSTAIAHLTNREREVLSELARGGANREIADRLFISENTVKNHVHNLLDKLDLANRRELIRFAQQQGLDR
ncbi:MAG: response regulator transcription factor [Chloroflexi bacterium]|nr:response regulator transcription factor [Chloroflexota bacterium]